MSIPTSAPPAGRFPNEITAALARWFNDMGGPTHDKIAQAIGAGGLDAARFDGNKPSRVTAALNAATYAQATVIAEELIFELREGNFFREDAALFARTQGAFSQFGHNLSATGYVTWNATTPTTPAPVRNSPLPVASPPPPLAQASDPTVPSHERLLWLLGRVPQSFSALVGTRRSGHEALLLRDEYDLQDATETALRLLYDDVRPEERTPSYASSSTTQDFLLFETKTMVEIKVTRQTPFRGDVKIRDEIIVDSTVYQGHPSVERMVFVVFDIAATISNRLGFEHDLSTPHNGMQRDTIVVPWPYPA